MGCEVYKRSLIWSMTRYITSASPDGVARGFRRGDMIATFHSCLIYSILLTWLVGVVVKHACRASHSWGSHRRGVLFDSRPGLYGCELHNFCISFSFLFSLPNGLSHFQWLARGCIHWNSNPMEIKFSLECDKLCKVKIHGLSGCTLGARLLGGLSV